MNVVSLGAVERDNRGSWTDRRSGGGGESTCSVTFAASSNTMAVRKVAGAKAKVDRVEVIKVMMDN